MRLSANCTCGGAIVRDGHTHYEAAYHSTVADLVVARKHCEILLGLLKEAVDVMKNVPGEHSYDIHGVPHFEEAIAKAEEELYET